MKRISIDSIDSTMNYLARLDRSACEDSFILVTADFQTAGRGQQGTQWESLAGKNLLFSIRLSDLPLTANHQFALAEAIALSLVEALNSYAPGFTIKWPNDIYWKHHKICGTLTQHFLQGTLIQHTIVGVGLNVNQCHFTSDAPNPISLAQILGREVCREQLLEAIIARIHHNLDLLRQGELTLIHDSYKQGLYWLNEWHGFSTADADFEGRIVDVEPSGLLVVEMRHGALRRFAFKEIQYAPKNS
jgi:BirA family biotin operon repressor/biotin-[acetyl-CoA-carboxylase] ligase